jgi:hypothetical protein
VTKPSTGKLSDTLGSETDGQAFALRGRNDKALCTWAERLPHILTRPSQARQDALNPEADDEVLTLDGDGNRLDRAFDFGSHVGGDGGHLVTDLGMFRHQAHDFIFGFGPDLKRTFSLWIHVQTSELLVRLAWHGDLLSMDEGTIDEPAGST